MKLLKNILRTGGIAALGTTAALVALAQRDKQKPVEVLNSVSHILHGDAAFEADQLDLEHTGAGIALNAASVTGWAFIQELILKKLGRRDPAAAATTAVAVTALAYVTDFKVVPKRLTPGFEEKLSESSLAALYGTLAITLAVGAMLGKD
jgi:hypothetical protein